MNIRKILLTITAIAACLSASAYTAVNDTAVRVGTLPNGLTYYIRHNTVPAGCADFFLARNMGSVVERENERGLAHFLEHMCFNGTEHFPGNSLISYLETRCKIRKKSQCIYIDRRNGIQHLQGTLRPHVGSGFMPADTARLELRAHPVRQGYRRRARCHSERMAPPQLVGQPHAGECSTYTFTRGQSMESVCQ